MMMAGSSVALFAQTTPTTTPTTPASPTTTPTTTSPVTTTPTATSPATNNVTNSTSDPVRNVTNGQPGTYTGNSAYPASTSWDAGTSPYWGWNSYGIWNNNTAGQGQSVNPNTSANNTTGINSANANTAMTSDNSYSASSGTAVTNLPMYVQTNFAKDYTNPDNRQYAWNQYGDWFSTHYTAKGRLTQYFYDQRGSGYSLSLPVIQTYVPEEIVDKALQKYGAHLYSIGMVKTADGSSAYLVGLINRGQLHSDYLNESGVTVPNVWRTEEMNLNSSASNAAMNAANGSAATQDLSRVNTDAGAYQDTTGTSKGNHKMKGKMKHGDSSATGNQGRSGKMKSKSKGRKNNTDSTMNSSGNREQ